MRVAFRRPVTTWLSTTDVVVKWLCRTASRDSIVLALSLLDPIRSHLKHLIPTRGSTLLHGDLEVQNGIVYLNLALSVSGEKARDAILSERPWELATT
ncbi:rRNA maturation endonuclease Nob1 [Paraburkholderia sp. GAS448]